MTTYLPQRLRDAGNRVQTGERELAEARAELAELARSAVAAGMTLREVAHLAGTSHQRISRLVQR